MLSVVIATQESERALLPTLAALVKGAAAGVVREVIIADRGSCDGTIAVADGAGCRVLRSELGRGARLKAAADAARAPWLLFLVPGVVPDATWVEDVRHFIEDAELTGHNDCAAAFRPRPRTVRPLLGELLSLLSVALGPHRGATQALLLPKSLYHALGGHGTVAAAEADLVRRLGRRRVRLLRSGIFVPQQA